MDKVFQEEQKKLTEIETKIDAIASRYETEIKKLQTEIDDFWVVDYEDVQNKQYLMSQRASSKALAEKFRSYQPSPYFGRLDLDCEVGDEIETTTYYIGKEGITDSADVIVADWRSPIGNLIHVKNQKKFNVNGVEYLLALRRSLDIRNGQLVSCYTEYDGETVSLDGDVVDPFLLTVLKDKRRHNRLTDIIRTIQGNQNEIIRKPRSESFVVQGCAGSGKTMILLHRLSYLKFNNRTMSLGNVKIITPNKFFDAHINDLSVELGLISIERFSVEEYYAYLIKKYSSKVPVDVEVQSEKILSADLLADIYSLQYLNDAISHYHEYWEQVLAALQESRLRDYFNKFGLSYLNTSLHTSATVSLLEQALHQMASVIAETEKKRTTTVQRLETVVSEISAIQGELNSSKVLLANLKGQTVSRVELEIAAVEDSIQRSDEKSDTLRAEQDDLQNRRRQLEGELRQATAVRNMFSGNASDFSDFDQFILRNDAASQIIQRELSDVIRQIAELESTYQKAPVYNFGKRNTLRKQIAEKKSQFAHDATTLVTTLCSNAEKKVSELRSTSEDLNHEINATSESIREEEKIIRNQRTRLSALTECLEVLNSSEMPDTQSTLTQSTHKVCAQILKSYEEQRLAVSRISRRLASYETTKADLEREQIQLDQSSYSKEDATYIADCTRVLKKLQFSEVTRNVMFKDLLSQYRLHKQKYQKTNYRHKVYLKLLYCSLYFARIMSPDTFLNIDEAQDISVAEYHLLRMVLGEKCVFNLYGDINQSVYSYKGITDWEDISDITGGNIYVLNENYRNTLQITDFCNKEFGAEVYPIGISGEDVVESDTTAAVKWILDIKKTNPDFRVAIIHRHGLKAIQECLRSLLAEENVSWYSVDDKKLSVLSVETAKGLEFEAVVAIVDQMSNNEKYISYTRALDQLAVVRDQFSSELDVDDTEEDIDDEFVEPEEDNARLNESRQNLVNVLEAIYVSKRKHLAETTQTPTLEYASQQLVSVLDEIRKKGEAIAEPPAEETFYTELSQEDNMLIAEFNSILEDRFEPMHRLTAAQQNIVLALYHGKSVACNAPSGSMKNVMLYLLALKEHQSSGKQTLLTAEAHLQENELVLADRLGLKGGIISTMAEFLADYKKDKYDIIFVSYEFFTKHENIAPFVDYFTNKVAYWGLDHPASAQDIWMQLNNCGVALDAVMFLMDKVGFGDLNLSNYQRIDIAGTADLGVVKKHTLFAPEEKLKWILANLDELSGQGLIYCDDEATCKSLSKSLRKNKVMAEAYIDVYNPEKKEHINYLTNSFTSGGLPILVTTHEAGKNLSNPHIRFIIHYDIPEDQELYQLHITQMGQLAIDAVVHDLLVV